MEVHPATNNPVLGIQRTHMDFPTLRSGIIALEKCTRSMPGENVAVTSYVKKMTSVCIFSMEETGFLTGIEPCIVNRALAKVDPLL